MKDENSDMRSAPRSNLLLIESNEQVRTLLAEVVRSQVSGLTIATSMQSATEQLLHQHFDIVLCDSRLGALTACKLAYLIIAHQPEAQLILMGGIDHQLELVLQNREVVRLPKPFAMDDLRDLISRSLANSSRETGHELT